MLRQPICQAFVEAVEDLGRALLVHLPEGHHQARTTRIGKAVGERPHPFPGLEVPCAGLARGEHRELGAQLHLVDLIGMQVAVRVGLKRGAVLAQHEA